ncbi:MAG: hypothetical protein IAE77_24355 [Prosthecobacter sp.]|jgi:hypothetical protein|uniref:hypothetical protein n=1 Tax=Prosthecobacter sp. TaxID=1965333 RepID=UPI0019FC10F6|nr:hypothetical protein [Prosthecobacter sp.]MBE2286610.1 hypothetical protein [Prosthecobacter sp.]
MAGLFIPAAPHAKCGFFEPDGKMMAGKMMFPIILPFIILPTPQVRSIIIRVTMICDFPHTRFKEARRFLFLRQSVGLPESVGENRIHKK